MKILCLLLVLLLTSCQVSYASGLIGGSSIDFKLFLIVLIALIWLGIFLLITFPVQLMLYRFGDSNDKAISKGIMVSSSICTFLFVLTIYIFW